MNDVLAEKDSLKKWIILLIASLFIFFVYMMQYQIASLAFLIIPQFDIDMLQLSNLMLIPMLLAAVFGIPLGALADRFGVKKVVGISLMLSVLGAFLRVVANDYAMILCAMMLLGFAPAALNSNVIKLFGSWFRDKTSLAIGIYYAFSGLGASAAMLSASFAGDLRSAFLLSALGLMVILIAWWSVVSDGINSRNAARFDACSSEKPTKITSVECFQKAAKVKAVWVVALITGFGLASKTAYLGFLPTALSEVVGAEQSGVLASFVTYGGVLGCAVGPAICLKRKHPKMLLVGFAIAASFLMGLSSLILSEPSLVLLFVVGMSTSITAPIVEAIPSSLPSLCGSVGSAGGIIGTLSLAMTYFIPILIAAISGNDVQLMIALCAMCFLLTVPLIMMLPKLTSEKARPDC